MGLFDFIAKSPVKDAYAATGGARDAYLSYLEHAASVGIDPMPYEQFVKAFAMLKQKPPEQIPQLSGWVPQYVGSPAK